MNKDTVIASALGFGLGLIAAIALWVVPRFLPQKTTSPASTPEQVVQDKNSPSPSMQVAVFKISQPKDGEIIEADSIDLTGIAPNALLVTIDTPSESKVIKPKSNDEFTTTLAVKEGANQIVVTSYQDQQQKDTKTITVFSYPEGI